MNAPTPLDQLTPEAVAKMDGPELWWYALQVMGFAIRAKMGDFWVMPITFRVESRDVFCEWRSWTSAATGKRVFSDMAECGFSEWQLFGLAVEWIEARLKIGELFRFSKNANGGDTDWIVTVWFNGSLFGTSSKAPTLTTAVLCWVVEHGEKIKEPRQ